MLMAVAALLFAAPQLPESLRAQGAQGVIGGVAPPDQGTPPAGRGDGRQGGRGGQGRGGGRGGRGGRQAGPPPGPAPRNAEGRALLSAATPTTKGIWLPTIDIFSPLAPVKDVPFMDWSRAVYNERQTNELEPHTRCKASGVSRQFSTPISMNASRFSIRKAMTAIAMPRQLNSPRADEGSK